MTCDSTSMHSKTNTNGSLAIVGLELDAFTSNVRLDWHTQQIATAVKTLLECDIFGDTCFKCSQGEEMGNPFTCIWRMLQFEVTE